MAKRVRNTNEANVITKLEEWVSNQSNCSTPDNWGANNNQNFVREQVEKNRRKIDVKTIFTYKGVEYLILIEAKKDDRIHVEGEDQVKERMSELYSESTPVIGIAASFDLDWNLVFTAFYQESESVVVELKTKERGKPYSDLTFEYLVSQILKKEEGISKKRKKVLGWKEIVSAEVAKMHEHVRNYCSASGDTKMNLLYGVLLALNSEDFRKNLNKYQDYQYSRNIYNAIISSMMTLSHDRLQLQNIKDSYAFLDIDSLPINKITVPSSILNDSTIKEKELSFSKFICNYIENFILKPVRQLNPDDYSVSDVASVIYNEFLKYNKSDAQDLGIVLTPEHICDLMIKLLDLKPEDVLLDVCTGTGAFLVAGMKSKIEHSDTATEEKKSCTGLIGIELQNHMYGAALANMVFNNGDISNLYLGSCYEQEIIDKIKELKPTKAVLNPPYAMYKNSECDPNLNELGFIYHAISFMPVGGKVIAIIPTACGIKDGVFAEYRDVILKNNRLDAVIECNPNLFVPAANVPTSIYLFTVGIPHDKSTTIYVDNRKDGYKSGKRGISINKDTWEKLESLIIDTINSDEPNEISRHFKTKIGKTWDSTEDIELILYYEDFYAKN